MVSGTEATNTRAPEETQDGNLSKRTLWNVVGLSISELSAFLGSCCCFSICLSSEYFQAYLQVISVRQ